MLWIRVFFFFFSLVDFMFFVVWSSLSGKLGTAEGLF
jgi:hypothetical protein